MNIHLLYIFGKVRMSAFTSYQYYKDSQDINVVIATLTQSNLGPTFYDKCLTKVTLCEYEFMPKLTQDNCLKYMPIFMPKTTNVSEYRP